MTAFNFIATMAFLLCLTFSSAYSAEVPSYTNSAETKVKVSLYYETLCPGCIGFVKDQLYPVYVKIPDYVNLDLVPYGNSKTITSPNGTVSFICQHGKAECYGNMVHACAVHLLRPEVSAAFVYCTMTQKRPPFAGLYCSKQLNITYAPIRSCALSDLGVKLHYQNGVRTNGLVPPHQWTPWVTFNDVWSKQEADTIETDLLSVICKHLTGGSIPAICNEVHFD
jgi:interferon gamma-inducible protein 30